MENQTIAQPPAVVTQVRIERALTEYASLFDPFHGSISPTKRQCPTLQSKLPKKKSKTTSTAGPLDYQAYLDRVSTFKLSTWCAKSGDLNPLECARFGWVNVGLDLLSCESCGAMLSLKLPSVFSESEVLEAEHSFAVELSHTHQAACPWQSSSSPSFFSRDPFRGCSNSELLAMFNKRLEALKQLNELPALHPSVQERLGDKDIWTDLNVKERTAQILALFGWSVSGTWSHEQTTNRALLHCGLCRNLVGIWNFKSCSEVVERIAASSGVQTNEAMEICEAQPTFTHANGSRQLEENAGSVNGQPERDTLGLDDTASVSGNVLTPKIADEEQAEESAEGTTEDAVEDGLGRGSQIGVNGQSAPMVEESDNPESTSSISEHSEHGADAERGTSHKQETHDLLQPENGLAEMSPKAQPDVEGGVQAVEEEDTSDRFNPVLEHRWYCPWIYGSERENSFCGWRWTLKSLLSEDDLHEEPLTLQPDEILSMVHHLLQ